MKSLTTLTSTPFVLEIEYINLYFSLFDPQTATHLLKSDKNSCGLHQIYNAYENDGTKFGNGNGDAFVKLGFWKTNRIITNGNRELYKDKCLLFVADRMNIAINKFIRNIVGTPISINPWICIFSLLPNDEYSWEEIKNHKKNAKRYFGMKYDLGMDPFDLMKRNLDNPNKNWKNIESFYTEFLNGNTNIKKPIEINFDFLNRRWDFKFVLTQNQNINTDHQTIQDKTTLDKL